MSLFPMSERFIGFKKGCQLKKLGTIKALKGV